MAKKRKKKAKTSKAKKKNNNKTKKKAKKSIVSIIITIIIIIAAVAVLRNFYPQKQKTAAIVNGEIITMQDLDARFELFKFLVGFESISKEILLEQMINEKLLLQEAAKQNIVVDEEEPEKLVNDFIERSFMTKNNLEKLLNANGLSLSDLEQYYEEQLIITGFIEQTLFFDVEVTDEEVKDFYDANEELFIADKGEIRARHILVETEEEAEDVLKILEEGKDFAELAKEISICPSASQGGELGFFSRGQMVSEFEDAAFALSVNEMSEPVNTEFGWHIIKREPNKIYLSEAEELIKEKLLLEKQKEQIMIYLDGLREKADIFNYLKEPELEEPEIIEEPELEEPEEEVVEEEVIEEVEEEELTEEGMEEITGEIIEEPEEESEPECFEDYDITADTVIFYHASWCPHCQNMIPVVEELEEEGYNLHLAETSEKEGTDVVEECFSEIIIGAVPQFICAGTRDFELGAMSKEELKEFADNCK